MQRSETVSTPAPQIETVVQGEFKISRSPNTVLSTLLGSCVAACIYDPEIGLGGMNHFLLPGSDHGDSSELKYGSMAMELLINDLLKAGAQRTSLKAKLFGGARIAANLSDIGAKNIAFARDYLARERFQVVSESLGGVQARRVHFRPSTGHVRMMLVPPAQAPQEYSAPKRPPAAKVELF
ncbi:MAG: chemotaxis protein CheD [Pseudomonadota bacterium]